MAPLKLPHDQFRIFPAPRRLSDFTPAVPNPTLSRPPALKCKEIKGPLACLLLGLTYEATGYLAIASLAAVASPTNRSNILNIQEETRWHGWVPSGQVVEVNNIHGNVRAEPATGDEIEVIAIKRGSGDPAQCLD